MSRLSGFISLIISLIAIPACCVVEYYSGLKMGMYRFVVLYNTKITGNILTPDLRPFISCGLVIIVTFALILAFIRRVKILWQIYGLALLTGSVYVLYFAESLKAAAWFALAVMLSGIFWAVSILTRKEIWRRAN